MASRASDYVTEHTWQGLFRTRHRGACHLLAGLAAHILKAKKWAHATLGSMAQRVLARFGRGRFEQALARELTAKIPLPFDVKFVAVARGIQVIGILVCLTAGRDLRHCRCFADLALAETKERVKEILKAAANDWTKLGNFPPQDSLSVPH